MFLFRRRQCWENSCLAPTLLNSVIQAILSAWLGREMVNSGTGQAASKIGLECFRRRNKIGAFLFENVQNG